MAHTGQFENIICNMMQLTCLGSHLAIFLQPSEVCAVTMTCRFLGGRSKKNLLWKVLCERDWGYREKPDALNRSFDLEFCYWSFFTKPCSLFKLGLKNITRTGPFYSICKPRVLLSVGESSNEDSGPDPVKHFFSTLNTRKFPQLRPRKGSVRGDLIHACLAFQKDGKIQLEFASKDILKAADCHPSFSEGFPNIWCKFSLFPRRNLEVSQTSVFIFCPISGRMLIRVNGIDSIEKTKRKRQTTQDNDLLGDLQNNFGDACQLFESDNIGQSFKKADFNQDFEASFWNLPDGEIEISSHLLRWLLNDQLTDVFIRSSFEKYSLF